MVTIEKISGTSLYSVQCDLTLSDKEYNKLREIQKISCLVLDKPITLQSILDICVMYGINTKYDVYKEKFYNAALGGVKNESECK